MRLKNQFFFTTVIILMILMSSFAYLNNNRYLVEKIKINFESHGAHFLSDTLVDKLLILNKGELPWKAKDSLVLTMLESLLENNPYVDKAEVFHFNRGILGVKIKEKSAVVRIQGPNQYYLDKLGNQFPVSINHTPKVPIYLGILKDQQKEDLLSLIYQIDKDPFFRTELASIHYRSNSFFIGLRSYDFEVEIGQIRRLVEKLYKLKVFCAYHENHLTKKEYTLINLKFKNQVIGS
tara:strand:- start:488 stop:1195 length:708 start_codon:yes stop_codon:yes gene_type:complete